MKERQEFNVIIPPNFYCVQQVITKQMNLLNVKLNCVVPLFCKRFEMVNLY